MHAQQLPQISWMIIKKWCRPSPPSPPPLKSAGRRRMMNCLLMLDFADNVIAKIMNWLERWGWSTAHFSCRKMENRQIVRAPKVLVSTPCSWCRWCKMVLGYYCWRWCSCPKILFEIHSKMLVGANTQDTTMLMLLVMMVTDYYVSPKVLVSTQGSYWQWCAACNTVDDCWSLMFWLKNMWKYTQDRYIVFHVICSPKGKHSCWWW